MISSGSPRVLRAPMGRTCGEPDEIGLSPMGVKLNSSGRVPDAEDRLAMRRSFGKWAWARSGFSKMISSPPICSRLGKTMEARGPAPLTRT